MKRFIIFIFLASFCLIAALWSPWLAWDIGIEDIFGVEEPDAIAGLQVNSISGELEVFIDGVYKDGVLPETSPIYVDRIQPGERLLTIKRKADQANAFWEFSKLIDFQEGVDVVASFYLGPLEEFSEGHIIYATPKQDGESPTLLNITVNVENAFVLVQSMEAQRINENEFTQVLDLSIQNTVRVSKPGYETLEFQILPETQEDRDQLENYNLNLDVHLMLQPLEVE